MQGKVCYWGTSEWSALDIQEAYEISRKLNLTPPSMEQPEYNMFRRDKMEDEYLPLFAKEKIGYHNLESSGIWFAHRKIH